MSSSQIRHALIMAAGRGNRMRPLTDIIPKAMLPFKDGTLIGHGLGMLSQSVEHVHVTVGYKSAMLSEYLMSVGGVSSVFNTEGHNNSWWVYNTLMRNIDEPVLVLTCDNITELDLSFINSEYSRVGEPTCMLVPVAPVVGIDGDYLTCKDDLVTNLQRQSPTDLYCSGIQVLNPFQAFAQSQGEDSFYTLWDQLIAQNQLRVSRIYPHKWFSVDTLEQLAKLA
jgi:NDP-sugar pyrophosphorylase family protein